MKTCEAKLRANAAWRERHREEHLRRRRERHAERMSDPSYVSRLKQLRDARKDEKSAYDREYREANRERARLNSRRKVKSNPSVYRAIQCNYKHRRRALESLGIESATLADWTAEQPKICFYCGNGCEDTFHVDHFIPLSKGGAHVLTNLRIACAPCNLKKNAKMPDEFMREVARSRVVPDMFQVAA